MEEFGNLDIMVNNAGIGSVDGIEEMDLDEYEQIRSVDLDGVVYGCKAATPYLRETEGSIINIASIYGLVGDIGATAYNAAKGGFVNLTRSVADDLVEHNVRVNSICPGFVDTPMTEDVQEDEEFMQHVMNQTPLTGRRNRRKSPASHFSSPRRKPATSPGSTCPWTADGLVTESNS